MINILILLIVLFYLNIININILKKYPVILLFLILNIIVIKNNKNIGLMLLVLLIILIINLKKKIKGGSFTNKMLKAMVPSLGLIERFQDYTKTNKNKENFDNIKDKTKSETKSKDITIDQNNNEMIQDKKEDIKDNEGNRDSLDTQDTTESEEEVFVPDSGSSLNIFKNIFGGEEDDEDEDDDELIENFIL